MSPCVPTTLFQDADRRFVGDPVDVVTGSVIDVARDLRLVGPVPLEVERFYDSSRVRVPLSLGNGHGHGLARCLVMGVDGLIYKDGFGVEHTIGAILADNEELTHGPWRLRRLDLRRYRLFEKGRPACDFEFLRGFDHPARLRRMSHGLAEIVLQYDAAGALTSILDSRARRIAVEETREGRLVRLVLEASPDRPARTLVAYEYDAKGNLSRLVDAHAKDVRFWYDAHNRLIRRTDRAGYSFLFEYDRYGRCVRTRGEDGLLDTRLTFDRDLGVTVVKRADGGTWQYFYDPKSKAIHRVVDPLGGVRQYVADEQGRPAQEIDALGNVTEVVCNEAGHAVAKRMPDGRVIPLPAEDREAAAPGHVVPVCPAEYEHGYLLDWRRIAPPFADGVAQLDLPPGVQRAVQGRMLGDKAAYTIDPDEPPPPGDSTYMLPKGGREFDDFGNLIRQVGPGGKVRRWQYDPNGNIAKFADFDGHEERHEYNSFNHRVRTIRPGGLEVRYEWNTTDQMSRVVDAGGTATEYVHDLRDVVVEIRRDGAVKERYARDAAGNLTARLSAEGTAHLTIEIGPGNRPVRKTLASGEVHEYAYDDEGRFVAIRACGQTTEFKYDAYGQRSKDQRGGLGVEHAPLTARRPGWTKVLGAFAVRYAHRLDGTVEITDPTGATHHVRPIGQGLVERALASGSREVSQYDPRGLCLMKCVYRVGQESNVWRRVFTYSGEGDLVGVDDSRAGASAFTYDGSHRITSVRRPGTGVLPILHDPAGNLIAQPGLKDVVIGPGNRLVAANGDRFEYNSRHHISRRSGSRTQTYTYDSRDRLVRVEGERTTWSATYDPIGRRTSVTDFTGVTTYYWDGDRLAAEVAPSGRTRVYVYEYPLAMTPMLFVEYDSPTADPATGRVFTVFADQIGTPVGVEDSSGAVVWRATIDPYGTAHVSPESAIDFHFRFPGHWFDPGTGLHYNRFRYYSPELGRYLQSDPAGLERQFNLYAYPPSPLANVDLRGLGCPRRNKQQQEDEDSPDHEKKPVAAMGDEEGTIKVANKAGMETEDLARLQRIANEDQQIIIVRGTNKNSLQHHDDPTCVPKPVTCKLKTDKETGLVSRRANPDEPAPPGFHWDREGNLRTNDGNKRLYGDHDLQGVYQKNDGEDTFHGTNTNDPRAQARINEAFDGRDMVQHGANDDYRPDGRMGRHPGEDESFVVIEPDGTSRIIGPPTSELQDYYHSKGIKWPYDDYHTSPPTPVIGR